MRTKTIVQGPGRPAFGLEGDQILVQWSNDGDHWCRDIYVFMSGKWTFLRVPTLQDIIDFNNEAIGSPGSVACAESLREGLAFSWAHTGKVCQRWQAFYASLPNQHTSNVI